MSINEFIELLKLEIANINNEVNKVKETSSKINKVSDMFNGINVFDISKNDIEFLESIDDEDFRLTNKEIEFIKAVSVLDESIKNRIKDIGLGDDQKAIVLSIKRKLDAEKIKYSSLENNDYNTRIEECKKTILLLTNSEIEFIDNIDFIKEILDKNNVDADSQIQLLYEINMANKKIFESLFGNSQVIEEEPIIDESNISETNLDYETVKEIFNSVGLNFDNIYVSPNADVHKYKLLKYGDYDKIKDILIYLVSKPIYKKVLKLPEILTKILLHSSVNQMEDVYNTATLYGIQDIIMKQPTVLFPTVRSYIRINTPGGGGGSSQTITGSLDRFLNNVNLIKSLGMSVKEAYDNCSTFFLGSPVQAKKTVDILNLYGINIYGKAKGTLCALDSYKICARQLDTAIEADFYGRDYCRDNLSRLVSSSVSFHKIKLARKKHNQSGSLGSFSPYINTPNSSTKLKLLGVFQCSNSKFGINEQETFKEYDAVEPKIVDKDKYELILENSDNTKITNLVLTNDIIRTLDQFYTVGDDKYRYIFDGVVISRLKVLRYLETMLLEPDLEINRDMLLYIIAKDSMLDEEELEKISKCLDNVKFARRSL